MHPAMPADDVTSAGWPRVPDTFHTTVCDALCARGFDRQRVVADAMGSGQARRCRVGGGDRHLVCGGGCRQQNLALTLS